MERDGPDASSYESDYWLFGTISPSCGKVQGHEVPLWTFEAILNELMRVQFCAKTVVSVLHILLVHY